MLNTWVNAINSKRTFRWQLLVQEESFIQVSNLPLLDPQSTHSMMRTFSFTTKRVTTDL